MGQLIDDLLQYSHLGRAGVRRDVVPLHEMCTSLASDLAMRLQEIGATMVIADDLPTVMGDRTLLSQISTNLLENAITYRKAGIPAQVTINWQTEDRDVIIRVSDNGIGIAPEDLIRLFKPFVQLDSRLNRRYEGTGLGLALVFRLTEMHGGCVHVESEVGKGSRFTISLPWKQQVEEQATALPGTDGSGNTQVDASASPTGEIKTTSGDRGTILLVEDNETNILAIRDYLQGQGFIFITAHNGIEGLAKAEETLPDLILMDIQMPVMDGMETIRHLRADPRFASTPIIALTALAMPGDRERCLEAGASDYLSKPVGLKQLTGRIDDLLKKHG